MLNVDAIILETKEKVEKAGSVLDNYGCDMPYADDIVTLQDLHGNIVYIDVVYYSRSGVYGVFVWGEKDLEKNRLYFETKEEAVEMEGRLIAFVTNNVVQDASNADLVRDLVRYENGLEPVEPIISKSEAEILFRKVDNALAIYLDMSLRNKWKKKQIIKVKSVEKVEDFKSEFDALDFAVKNVDEEKQIALVEEDSADIQIILLYNRSVATVKDVIDFVTLNSKYYIG